MTLEPRKPPVTVQRTCLSKSEAGPEENKARGLREKDHVLMVFEPLKPVVA